LPVGRETMRSSFKISATPSRLLSDNVTYREKEKLPASDTGP
jgi:hypothetical protein